ncbi:DUF4199 domain-containing protein [Algoriphagus aestuariicola]|jgi:hypothetical protein|uniref:DUF4199 domain-containing protein n=1 Tax=Algoriphagus aestuariicola TaxID=1852016 RepID=A0ABS3BVU8_9BACT|nr:DUF4199 domain-containing protein [Algoriphagus aestuariicola]MBN7803410.1 DUF4199 domain-containing protein [Algoriphagus aestuariicola]
MEEQQTPFQAAIKPGLTMGLVALAITYIAYFIDSSLLASLWLALIGLVVFFGLIIYFGKQYRAELGGFMSFGTAFNFSFVAMIISGIISLIGQILLFHVIDPSLPGVLTDIAFQKSLEMMEGFGQNPDSLPPATLDEIRNSTAASFSIGGQLKNFGIGLIIYAIIALILAAILKKRDKSLDY